MRNFLFKIYLAVWLFGFVLLSQQSKAQSISGYVSDAKTGEPMVGATVTLKGTNTKTFVKLDGSFSFKNLPIKSYTVEFTSTQYKNSSYEVDLLKAKHSRLNASMESIITELGAITITAGMESNDRRTKMIERNANQLLNVMSAKSIQLLPDITVANVLQRVSGVTIEKSGSGEAKYPIIRGMEKRYINTLVNGTKIPSPDNKNRFVPLDLFPSELLDRLEVVKSLTPNMEGDAIGGTINLMMKEAPAVKTLNVNAALGYNNFFDQHNFAAFYHSSMNMSSPLERFKQGTLATPGDFPTNHFKYRAINHPVNATLGITYGDRFGVKKKLGVMLSASYQDIYRGATSNFFLPNSQPGLNNIPLFSNLQLRNYSVETERLGLNAKVDYKFNDRNKISLVNTLVSLNDYQTRIVFDTVALNSLVNHWQRSSWQQQTIHSMNLNGTHKLPYGYLLDWTGVYSVAKNKLPDQSQYIHQYAIVSTSLTNDKMQGMDRIWSHNKDRDFTGYLNVTKQLKIFQRELEWKIGAMYRNKERDNFYVKYSLSPVLGQVFTTLNYAGFVFNPASDGLPSLNGNNYHFTENISAAYAMAKFQVSRNLELLGGLRGEHTEQRYETLLGKAVDAKSGTIKYLDLLPSAQLKYQLSAKQLLRMAYYRAISRPGFSEMIPDGSDGEFFKEIGDPVHLKHTIADNIDLRYEFYSSKADQVLVGVFYKDIQNPIEISAVKPLNVNNLYLVPVNIGNATNYGFEAVVTKYIGHFGISANYTYTKSSITNDSLIYSSRNTSGLIVSSRVSETRPLQGQSDHIGNLSFIYKNPKIGLDVQTAVVYTGERINFVSPYMGLNYWQSPTTQLDLSFEKRIAKGLTFYGKMNNLTNTPFELSLHQSYNSYMKSSGSRALALQTDPDQRIIIQKDYYKTSFLFGIRYKF